MLIETMGKNNTDNCVLVDKNGQDMRVTKPKGILIAIGGGEDKSNKKEILSQVIKETQKEKPNICLVTIATSVPEEVEGDYRAAFESLGQENLSVIHYTSYKDADDPQDIKKVKECDVVLFSGGDQLRLSSLLGGTEIMDIIMSRYYDEPTFVVAGTSAGASAMSTTMIVSGSSKDAMLKGALQLANGLGLARDVFIDTHFTQRGRFGRIAQTVIGNPGILGMGLGEDTGVIIRKGEVLDVIGSGLVVIIDGSNITYSDLTEISDWTPITVEGMSMHMLGPGKKFYTRERKLVKEECKK